MAIASEKNLVTFPSKQTQPWAAWHPVVEIRHCRILNIPFVFVIGKQTCANATTKLCKLLVLASILQV